MSDADTPQAPATPADAPSKRPRWRRWALDIGLFMLAFIAIQWWQARDVPRGPAPAFEAEFADGSRGSLAAWRAAHPGQAVGVYFWAEWCPICKVQEGTVDALRADWPVLGVAMQSGDAPAVSKVLKERGLEWPTAVDADGRIAASYGVRGVPALVVIDADGAIRSVAVGYTTGPGMRLRMWWAELAR